MAPDARLAGLVAEYAQALAQGAILSPAEFCQQRGCPEWAGVLAERWAHHGPTAAAFSRASGQSDGYETLAPTPQSSPQGQPLLHSPPGVSGLGRVGRYDLQEVLAHGGMGTVYRAVDTIIGRDVAVKLIHERYVEHPAAARRFFKEARITGQLQHPGIPPVHEIGTMPDGRLFLAMKLIQGQTLAALIGRVHEGTSARDSGPNGGTTRRGPASGTLATAAERGRQLAIFESVCQAMAYAHSRGVIHRDLKPANIMVGAFGEVQVMDWGLAKRIGDDADEDEQAWPAMVPKASADRPDSSSQLSFLTEVTQPGAVLGTPAFMPPEQAQGALEEIDQQSDVFGLGAILCCLLTGEPPHVADTPELLLYQASRGEMTESFARLDGCGADPAVIALCKQCLAGQKKDRPPDAGAVAIAVATIRTQTESRARQAERETAEALVREAEQRKRRRVLQWAGGLLAVVLTLGLAASLWQMERAITAERQAVAAGTEKDNQRRRAEDNERAAKEQRALAQEQERLARLARNQAEQEKAVALAVREFLQTRLLRQANPWEQSGAADSQSLTVRELVDRAAREFNPQSIAEKFPRQPLVQAEILETLGETYEGLGEFGQVLPFMKAAHQLRETHLGPNHPTTLASMTSLTFAHIACGKHADAIPLILSLLTRLEAALQLAPSDAAARIDAVLNATERRLNPRRFNLPAIAFGLGEGAMLLLQVGQALPRLQRLADQCTKLFGPDDRRTLLTRLIVGFAHHALGQLRPACDIYELVLGRAQASLDPDDWVLQGLREILAITYGALGIKRPEQVMLIEECARTSARLLGPEHPRTLATQARLAEMHHADGRLEIALPLFEKVLEARLRRLGTSHPDTLSVQHDLAQAYLTAGRHQAGLTLLETVRDAEVKTRGPEHANSLFALHQLALAYQAAGRITEATATLEQLRATLLRLKGPDHADTLTVAHSLGVAYRAAGRWADAITLLEKVRDDRSRKLGPENSATLLTTAELAYAHQLAGQLPEALALFEKLLAVRTKQFGVDHHVTLTVMNNLAWARFAAGQLPESLALHEETLQRRRTVLGPRHAQTLLSMNNVARVLVAMRRGADAQKLYEDCLVLRQAVLGPRHADTLITMSDLALLHQSAGRHAKAIQLLEQVRTAREATLGAEHPDTLVTLVHLSRAYREHGQTEQGVAALSAVLERVEKVGFQLGGVGPLIREATLVLEQTGKMDQAETWQRKWLAVVKEKSGSESAAYAGELAALGLLLLKQEKWQEAESVLRECQALREKLQPELWTTFNSMSMLGHALLGRASGMADGAEKVSILAEAERLLTAGYEGMVAREKSIPADFRVQRLGEALERLILYCKQTGQLETAKKWEAAREALRAAGATPPAR